jgi:hypothetical protein
MLIQGSATLRLYLFNLVKKELDQIDPDLMKHYGILASIVQLNYWILSPGMLAAHGGEEETQMGSEEAIPKGDIYIIKARGVVFPYLVHEIVKGIYEWASIDPAVEDALKDEDLESLKHETEDIIVGPELFKILMSYVPSNKQELLPLVHKKVIRLSREQVKAVLAKSEDGKKIMDQVIKQSEEEWEDYQQEKRESDIEQNF